MACDLYIDFQLLGTKVHPKEISAITGIQADTALGKGERRPELNLPRQNIWSICSASQSDEVKDHWEEINQRINKAYNELKALGENGKVVFTIVINSECENPPSIIIPPEMSKVTGFLGAFIDIH